MTRCKPGTIVTCRLPVPNLSQTAVVFGILLQSTTRYCTSSDCIATLLCMSNNQQFSVISNHAAAQLKRVTPSLCRSLNWDEVRSHQSALFPTFQQWVSEFRPDPLTVLYSITTSIVTIINSCISTQLLLVTSNKLCPSSLKLSVPSRHISDLVPNFLYYNIVLFPLNSLFYLCLRVVDIKP